ncbi:hypothetical protein [Bordetella hinzii]|uniref:hypothetical protein n=1 Tax=Bordetella hinzii TaxID=103855 RepID=UPI0039FDB6B6
MTDKNTPQPVLTDEECISILKFGSSSIAMARAIESAVLSKLRAPVADGEWPTLSDLHLQALMFAYNEGYSKAIDGRKFKNPFETSGSQAAAWELGTQDGTEARSKMESAPVAGYIKPDPAAPTHPRYVSELKYRSAADAEADPEGKGWLKVYAAPQASAETAIIGLSERDRHHVREFINCDGLGSMVVEGPRYSAVVRALKTQADKDRGQQRAGDVVEVCPDCDIAGCQHIRASAALSATQAEQGERDAN